MTPDRAIAALLDLLDGVSLHDLEHMTGLPDWRCNEIFGVYRFYAAKREQAKGRNNEAKKDV